MKEKDAFEREMRKLGEVKGRKAVCAAYEVLSLVLEWATEYGHGQVTLSAINHIFGDKVKFNTIRRAAKTKA